MANIFNYYFPYLRRGLGAIAAINPTKKRVSTEIKFEVIDENNESKEIDITKEVSLYGPGDVLGFNPQKAVVRVQPTANDGNFTANNVPFIEFSEPDFLWRHSAVKENGNWIPWLTLIVLEMKEGDKGEFEWHNPIASGLPSCIKLTKENVLPHLETSWRWAHVHCSDVEGKTVDYLNKKIQKNPGFAVSRLFCARKLKAGVKYCAFVVPSYKLGWEAASGIENTNTTLSSLTWEAGSFSDLLPYYYKWEFRTGLRGDFEDLARLIKPRPLEKLGGKKINIENAGYGIITPSSNSQPRIVEIEGVLQSSDKNEDGASPPVLSNDEKKALIRLLNKAEEDDGEGGKIRTVVPPIYGRWINHDQWDEVDLKANGKDWLHEVNLDLRYRIAAGLGVQYIKENQEELMNAAWQQLEKVNKINAELKLKQFGNSISKCLHKRFNFVKNETFIGLATPVSSKLRGSDKTTTIAADLRDSTVSNLAINPKIRKYQNKVKKVGALMPSFFTADIGDLSEFFPFNTVKIDNIVTPLISPVFMPPSKHKIETPPVAIDDAAALDWVKNIPNTIKEQIAPSVTIAERMKLSIKGIRDWEDLKKPDSTLTNPLRMVMFYPQFLAPMYKYLLALSTDYFVPNLDKVPQNTVSALITNRKFIEAFMLGLNHEFASELRWREYPTDMRGSYFRKFWDTTIYSVDDGEKDDFFKSSYGKQLLSTTRKTRAQIEDAFYNLRDETLADAYEKAIEQWLLTREEEMDIKPLHLWNRATKMGTHKVKNKENPDNSGDNNVVLMIRADLLRKFPNTFVYLVKGKEIEKADGTKVKAPDWAGGEIAYPTFEADLPPDISCLGFPFDEDKARAYWLVFENRASEQRLGLDVSKATDTVAAQLLENLSWGHFDSVKDGDYLNNKPIEDNDAKKDWNKAAFIAKAFTQQPIRIAIDLDDLLPK